MGACTVGKRRADVDLGVEAHLAFRAGRRARETLEAADSLSRSVVNTLHVQIGGHTIAPPGGHRVAQRVQLGGRASAPGVGAVEHQLAHPLGVAGREQDRQWPTLGDADDRRPLDAAGVEHGSDVIHPVFERAGTEVAVRQSGPALVEDDQAREARHALHQPAEDRQLPHQLDVGHEPGNPQHGAASPDILIGDRRPTRVGVLGPWG